MIERLLALLGLASAPAEKERRMPLPAAGIIHAFAAGDETLRSAAIAIHRDHISSLGARGTLEQRFMAEIDNPAPDLALREVYRRALLARKPGMGDQEFPLAS